MKTKWLILFVLLLLAAPAAVQAQFIKYTNTDGSIYDYSINANNTNTITIHEYNGPTGAVIIPSNMNNLLVTSIAEFEASGEQFNGLINLTIPDSVTSIGSLAFFMGHLGSVMIPGSVTNIGLSAFFDCNGLTSVTLDDGVTSIGTNAFGSCTALTNVTIPSSVTSIGTGAFSFCLSLTSATIADGVTNIGFNAFDVTPLSSITIPGSVSTIGSDAFGSCIYATNLTLGNGVASIGANAFSDCISLSSVLIPASVTNIGMGAFERNYRQTNFTVDAGNPDYSSVNGVLFDKTQTTLIAFPGGVGGSYTIPSSVTNIVDDAFYYCISLTNIYFQGNAPTADSNAFTSDTNATIYYLPGTTGWSNTFAGIPALLWNPQPLASGANFGVQSNQFGFNITGTSNLPMVVEACTNLANPVWIPLQTNTLTNGSFYFSEPLQSNTPGRFYRISAP
jgi:hypothetical protein